jgi:hypothetical protein
MNQSGKDGGKDKMSVWLKPDQKDKSKLVTIPEGERITKVYWPSEELFKPARDEEDKGKKGKEDEDEEGGENSSADE